MTQPPMDPESLYGQLLAKYDEALATATDTSAVSPQAFVTDLADAKLQQRFDRVQACLNLLDQDRRRLAASSTRGSDSNTGPGGQTHSIGEAAAIPRQIGRFRVIRRLGSGGFGVVFLAEDPVLRRRVAIKMPLASIFQSQELHARFLRECRAAAKLDHPGIVRVLESGDVHGIPYQVAEFVDGERLSDLLRREKMSVRSAAVMVRSLADALQHAHDHGVLHRDIKPDNILLQQPPIAAQQQTDDVTADPSVIPTIIRAEPISRITDFGLARLADDDTALSRSGTLVGTPKYMSPEQLKGQTAAHGPQSDIYSLGVVLYELLTGTVPFLEADSLQSRVTVSNKSIAPFRCGRTGISKDLETISLKCLQLRSSDRYQSAGDLRDDLGRYLDGRPTLARPIPVYEQFFRWISANRVLGVLLATVVLAILGLLVQAIRNDRASREQNSNLVSTVWQLTTEKRRADESSRLANANRIAAEHSEARYRDVAWLAQHREYSTSMMQASAFWQQGEIASMNRAILQFRSSSNAELRGFEWNYLWAQGQKLRPLIGHLETVQAFGILDDGEHAYTIGNDNSIRRWIIQSGELESSWELADKGPVAAASISDGSRRAVISQRVAEQQIDVVTVWDLNAGRTLKRETFPIHEIDSVAISHDGKTVVVGGRHRAADGKLLPFAQIWIPDQDRVITDETTFCTLIVDDTRVLANTLSAMEFAPDDASLVIAATGFGPAFEYPHSQILQTSINLPVSSNGDGSESVFGPLKQISWQRGRLQEMTLSSDGTHLAAIMSSETNWADVWELKTMKLVQSTERFSNSIDCIAFDASGTKLGFGVVTASLDAGGATSGTIKKSSSRPRSEFKLWDFASNSTAILPYREKRDLTFLKPITMQGAQGWIVGEAGGSINLWWPEGIAPYRELNGHRPLETWDLALSQNGSTLYSVGDDHFLRSWDLVTGTEKGSANAHSMLASCVAVSPDGRWVATGGYDHQIVVYDAKTLKPVATLTGHSHNIRALAFSADSRLLASGGRDKIIRLWQLPGFELTGMFNGHSNTVRALSWTVDGQLFSSDSDGKVLQWNRDGQLLKMRSEHEGVHCLVFAPAGLRVPARESKSASRRSDLPSIELHAATTSDSAVLTMHSNELLALGMNHGTVRLLHLPTDTTLLEAQHPGVEIRSLAFSPDGRTLAVAGNDEKIHLWHIATGKNLLTLDKLGASVHRVMYSPDGSMLLAAMHDGTIRMWLAPLEK